MADTDRIHRRRWATLAILCVSLLVIVLDNTIVNVALPTLVRDMGTSITDLQWVVDAYTLVFAGLLLTAGSLGDRFGRKGALTVGLVIFGGFTIIDFNRLRSSTPDDAVPIAAGIFLDVFNVFLLALDLFGGGRD